MIQLPEMRATLPMKFDGIPSTTSDVWEMLMACERGDLDRVMELVAKSPVLAACKYNYMPPLHLAIRDGHIELVKFLLEHGGLVPNYKSYPFLDEFHVIAQDREHAAIAQLLAGIARDPSLASPCPAPGDGGEINYGDDEESIHFRRLVSGHRELGALPASGRLKKIEAMLNERPELAHNEFQFWGEGILSVPSNHADHPTIELLLRYGARVPDVTKWGAWYYFKHYDTGKLLLDHGMSPNHMSWQRVTLLHDMAWTGDACKAQMLLDRGADINPIDEEFRSTPLGLAARWGKRDVVQLLIERGADVNAAGEPWARPVAWARRKGHGEIERLLLEAGAQKN